MRIFSRLQPGYVKPFIKKSVSEWRIGHVFAVNIHLQPCLLDFSGVDHDVILRAGGESNNILQETGLPAFAGNDMSVAKIK